MTTGIEPKASAITGNWVIEPSRSTVTVTATAFGFKSVPANLKITAGSIRVDNGKVAVKVSIDPKSVDTGNAKRDEHLRDSDFLDVEKYPQSTFTAEQPWQETPNSFQGVLVVKDKRVNVTLDLSKITFDGEETVASFTGKGQLNRDQVGLTKAPSFMIKRQLTFTISVQARHA
jgi:polyisoprenoid-binding protein YceI